MKKKILLAGVTSCLLVLSGCNNEMMDPTENQSGVVPMTMSTDVTPQTRADYTSSGSDMFFSWRSGDEISVVVDGVSGNENRKLTTSTAAKSAPFNGSVSNWSGTKNVYAFYPYLAGGYTVTGGSNSATATAGLTLPNPQLFTIGGAISNSFIVGAGTASATGIAINASATMKQVMSIIQLNIVNAPGKVTGVKLICADAVFPTTATVKLSDGTISNPGTLTNTLSMTVTDPTSGTNKSISFAMFPANLTGKTIHIEVTFQGNYVKVISKAGQSFLRNKHYTVIYNATGAYQYVNLGGLKWATGNLVADGITDAKIGAPTDGGLYFQYASLVGWSGGATGDGTGRGTNSTPARSQWVVPIGYTGSTSWSSSWVGDASTDVASAGTGDPCRYYVGELWRLPTRAEFEALITASPGYPSTGPWIAQGTFVVNSTTSYMVNNVNQIQFAAAGVRASANGNLSGVGLFGTYNSSTPNTASNEYTLEFTSSSINPALSSARSTACPVRCVRN